MGQVVIEGEQADTIQVPAAKRRKGLTLRGVQAKRPAAALAAAAAPAAASQPSAAAASSFFPVCMAAPPDFGDHIGDFDIETKLG